MSRSVALLGSTGSIGTQAVDIVTRNPERFTVTALSAGGGNLELLARQAVDLRVEAVGVARGSEDEVRAALSAAAQQAGVAEHRPTVYVGEQANQQVARHGADVVLNGITGSIGLAPTLAALESGSTLALANKESLIVGGPIVRRAARPDQIVPVDSEHSAVAQCLRSGRRDEVRRLVITASGGPFRGRSRESLRDVTPAEALAHPTWDMGKVVTTNSATLVNKGLEVIEAHLLFDVPFSAIDVVVHPTSDVHSMVEFVDGSTILQASPPTMLIPIALGLAWPDRVPDAAPAYDWTRPRTFEFYPLDPEAFRSVPLAYRVGEAGGTYPAVYNAANEECVEAFHAGRIGFLDIVDTIERVVDEHHAGGESAANPGNIGSDLDVPAVLRAEAWARRRAREILGLAPLQHDERSAS
ncbi:1-deoxy-D-xylulose-5-phosphate reductoisomerase [Arsenicicoccus piscis]|uniref:1-deoxy-D-xylulose 5-phosphate reductoisomerase n=1 Tax=Arsenicicoccus piscis TaxID=673954 RepID=A0ABQ6HNY0_9MICO|nr:1-deoxy-D-xylulose-5-phosphate reductoisomerase [Arsenicicoccus piscis]MCH8628785.1 1-deoxy-D-xylulose-5-phosphate reductoisomerase [Arsenicicoccus piscis]GMA20170.1 1-deoxy-D-xylulose 5-phosphate reductoisomerase [Arsenicicoccus piscis]